MAKKITINGSNLLQQLTDAWGGTNDTASPQTIHGTPVPVGAEWGMNRGEVERFIKAQIGGKAAAFAVDSGILYAFASEADKVAWENEEYDDKYVLDKVTLPSGGDTQSDTLSIFAIDTRQYYRRGRERVQLRFRVRNIVDGEPQTQIDVAVTNAAGATLYSAQRPAADSEGYYTATINGADLRNVANTKEDVILTVTRSGEERNTSRTLEMYCVELSLALDANSSVRRNVTSVDYIPTFVLPTGTTNIKLVTELYDMDDSLVGSSDTTGLVTNNAKRAMLNWGVGDHYSGVYTVKAWLDMGNGMVQSDVVETKVLYIREGDETTTALIAIEPIGEVTLYDDVTPHISVYYRGEETAIVELSLNNGATTRLEVQTNFVYTGYTMTAEQTNNVLTARVLNGSGETVGFAQEEFLATGAFNWTIVEGYEQNLSAKGRTNDEKPSPANWGGVTSFEGFSWNTHGSCWKDNALHLVSGGKAVIGITPFYSQTAYDEQRRIGGGILDKGRTLRMRFKVENASDTTSRIMECYDGNVGFFITADTIYVKMGNGGEITTDPTTGSQATQNNRHFSTGEWVELCVTVQPYYEGTAQTKHFATMYINGQFAGEAMLSDTTLSQTEALPITIHPKGCVLDVSQVTYYEKCLTSFEVLRNSVMAMNNLAEMKSEFEKNQCYTGDGTVDFNETFKYCKWLSARLGNRIEGTCNILVNTYTFNPAVSDTNAVAPGQQELELFFFRNGEVDVERSVKYVGENADEDKKDLRVRIQGTSTASEFRKNMRYDGKKKAKVFRWSEEGYINAGSRNPSDGWYDTGETVKKLAIYLRGDSETEHACSLLTTKTNYNESTATRNLPMARWVDDATRALAAATDGNGNVLFPNLLTPPQKLDARVRQAIDGLPAVQFTHDVGSQDYHFSGKIDLITDKKNSSVFGFQENMDGAHPDFSIEFRNGDTDVCNFRCPYLGTAGKYMDSSFSTRGQDCLEYRWPDLDTGDTYYGDSILRADSAMQRLFDFVFNCHWDFIGYKSKNGVISRTNGTITILGRSAADNEQNRKDKFVREMGNYMVADSIIFNAFVTRVLLWTDQRAKNQFFTHFSGDEITSAYSDDMNVTGQTYEVLRLLPYDIDTSLRGDNASRLRYDFTRLYSDVAVYNDGVGVTTISQAYFPTQEAIADPQAFIRDRVLGKKSALFELLDATCQQQYASMFDILASSFLTTSALKRYCITEEADAFNSVIYNADTQYKYVASGKSSDQMKAHGSAKEDLLWWIEGRTYYMGGENNAQAYAADSFYANLAQDSALDETRKRMRIPGESGITMRIKSRCRNYVGTKLGSGGQTVTTHADDPSLYYSITLATSGITNEDGGRFRIFGQRFIDDFEDLSHLFVSQVNEWAGGTGIKTLKFGSDREGFYNDQLTDIGASENSGNVFAACEVVDLRNCTVYAESNFRCFPAMKTLLLGGCVAMTELRLPETDNIETLAMPHTITKLALQQKTKLSTLTMEKDGTGNTNLRELTCEGIGNTVAASVLALLGELYDIE